MKRKTSNDRIAMNGRFQQCRYRSAFNRVTCQGGGNCYNYGRELLHFVQVLELRACMKLYAVGIKSPLEVERERAGRKLY